jgi:zinc transporter ZupT
MNAMDNHRAHSFDAHTVGKSGWMILIGDSMHNFTDGILIAAAFLANPKLGLVPGLAIIAHEILQEIGDFILLLNAGFARTRAYVFTLSCPSVPVGIINGSRADVSFAVGVMLDKCAYHQQRYRQHQRLRDSVINVSRSWLR